jgi:hypothetical protein
MIVGGVHGNETAGYTAAGKLKNIQIRKGTLLVLPKANIRAVNAHCRYISGEGDLNRDFPTSKTDKADTTLARAIFEAVQDYDVDWLMDLHEGYDYSVNPNNSSVGQTMVYYPDMQTKTLVTKIKNSLNSQIYGTYKDFRLLRYPKTGSLASAAAKVAGANSFIFETCSQPSLTTRVNYQLDAAYILLDYVGMR